jgi:hypothetical protein
MTARFAGGLQIVSTNYIVCGVANAGFQLYAYKLLLPTVFLFALTSCAHPNRVSRGALRQLAKNREAFVLVFGSLSTSTPTLARPTIRFSHQASRSAPIYLLRSLTITSGDRFYAILRKPEEASYALPYLDEFYIEAGDDKIGFDRINYVRLHQMEMPLAMYVGEIQMSPAPSRLTAGQKIVVNVRDDFRNATVQLKRLYPGFPGTIATALDLRNPVAAPAGPSDVR